MTAAETRDDGKIDGRDAAEMYNDKDVGGRYEEWWRRRRTRTAGETQVDEDGTTRHAR